jgi:cytochrome P450
MVRTSSAFYTILTMIDGGSVELQTVTTVLLELAARPEYQVTLRDEIKSVVASKGWTLEAIEAMSQLDSFMLETRRFRPLADIMLNRMCLQDTTLSDGTTITPGTTVSVGYSPRLLDGRYYSSPTEFDGLRYYNTQERFTDIDGAKFLGFGAGKHAW